MNSRFEWDFEKKHKRRAFIIFTRDINLRRYLEELVEAADSEAVVDGWYSVLNGYEDENHENIFLPPYWWGSLKPKHIKHKSKNIPYKCRFLTINNETNHDGN